MKKHAFSTPFAALVALSLSGASALAQPQEELAPGFDACVQQSGGATLFSNSCKKTHKNEEIPEKTPLMHAICLQELYVFITS